MPAVVVFPGAPDPTHDISLSDGTYTYGFKFAGGPRVLQEVPLSPPAEKFNVEQKTFVGGRGNTLLQNDATGFNDSSFLWTTSDNRVMPGPQWNFFPRADADAELPGDNASMAWWKLYGNDGANKICRYLSRSFVAASSSVAADKAYLHIRRRGTPGTLTLEYCADSSGSPGAVSATVTKTYANITDTLAVYVSFDWSGTVTRTAGTTYHLKVYGASTDDADNHWEVLVNTGGTSSKYYNGSSWLSANASMYYRVTGADTKRQWKWFTYNSGFYAVSLNDNKSSSTLLLNGTRGDVKSATSTTLVSTIASITANMFVPGAIRIINGTGDGQYRTITSNTATTAGDVTFTVPAWDITPDTTSKFVVYGTSVYTAAVLSGGSPAIGTVTNEPAIINGVCYFPRGNSSYMMAMRSNGNAHDTRAETAVKADVAYANVDPKNGVQLAIADAALAQIGLATPVTWGTSLTDPTKYSVGISDYRITNIANQGGTLNIFKEDGRYTFDGTRVVRKGANFKDVPAPGNGKAVGFDDKYMWWSWGSSVIRSLADTDTDMLNWRQGYEGLAYNKRGEVTCIVSAVGWVFVVIDGGSDKYSSILMWNGYGWHEVFSGWEPGIRIRNAAWQANLGCRSRLWFDVNGELAYMEFPFLSANPLKDTTFNYHHEGVLVTSVINLSEVQLYKIFSNLRVVMEYFAPTGSPNYSIEIDYITNESPGWVPIGTTTASKNDIALDVGNSTLIRFRFRFQVLNSRIPSVMASYGVDGRIMPFKKYQYIATFTAGADMETMTGEPDTSSNTIYSWLQDCSEKQKALTLRSLNSSNDNKVVTVTMPAKSVDWVDETEWGGRISFAMLET